MRVATNVHWQEDAANPYITRLYRALDERGVEIVALDEQTCYDLVHLHWPELVLARRRLLSALFGVVDLLTQCWMARHRGARIVWTAHNIEHHERRHPVLERAFWLLFVRLLDGVIYLSTASRDVAEQRRPRLRRVRSFVIRHGDYCDSYPSVPARLVARTRYGMTADEAVVLYFGQVRPYKNVPRLVEAVRRSGSPMRLIVAGKPLDTDSERAVLDASGDDPRVLVRLEWIPDEEVPSLFAAADLVVLPFRSILNSGSVMLALSTGRPVLVPRLETLTWMRKEVGSQWIHVFDGELTSEDIVRALRHGPNASDRPDLAQFTWERVADETRVAYQAIATGGSPPLEHDFAVH